MTWQHVNMHGKYDFNLNYDKYCLILIKLIH